MSASNVTNLMPTDRTNSKCAKAYFEMEGGVCDLYRMATIRTEAIYEVEEAHDSARRGERMEIAIFASEQLRKMIGELKDGYYRDYHVLS